MRNKVYLPPESNWVHPGGKLNLKFFYKDKLHLSEEGYHKFSLYILKILASAPKSFVNSSISTYEYAIGEFEALSPTRSTVIQSSVHSHCTRTFLCQDDFSSILSNVGSSSSYINLPTWPVFSAISLPFVCLSVCTISCSTCFPFLPAPCSSVPAPCSSVCFFLF